MEEASGGGGSEGTGAGVRGFPPEDEGLAPAVHQSTPYTPTGCVLNSELLPLDNGLGDTTASLCARLGEIRTGAAVSWGSRPSFLAVTRIR